MACAYPMIQFNKTLNRFVQIPCGRCLNCMVDRRTAWEERAEWEYKSKLVGSFVTLTYADETLIYKRVTDNQGATQFSLDKKDLQEHIETLRKNINELEEGQRNETLINPRFSYLACGEYGESNKELPRPHFHILYFGLDYQECAQLIAKSWNGGIVDVRPIMKGGIRYVLKYMDKQLNREETFEKYERHMLQRPFKTQSKGFGQGLYLEKIQTGEANEKNDWTYKGKNNATRRIPEYYITKFAGVKREKAYTDISKQIELYNQAQNAEFLEKGNCLYFPKLKGKNEVKKLRDFNIRRARAKEENMTAQMRAEGKPVNDTWKLEHKDYWEKAQKDENDKKLAQEAQQWYDNHKEIF